MRYIVVSDGSIIQQFEELYELERWLQRVIEENPNAEFPFRYYKTTELNIQRKVVITVSEE